jgi:hypothetical protein
MPFDSEFDSIYNELLKPALEQAGYSVARADSFLDQENIMRDIVRGIANSDLIVVDLTTHNPNVLYELGLAHGLRIPTILLAQNIEEVPFDLRGYRVIVYSIRFNEVAQLTGRLGEIGERHKHGEITFGSPVIDFLPPQITSIGKEPGLVTEPHPAREKKPVEEEEKGALDRLVEVTEATQNIVKLMSDTMVETKGFTGRIEARTSQLRALDLSGPGASRQAHNITLLTAQDMASYAGKVEAQVPQLEANIDALSENLSALIASAKVETEEDKKGLLEFQKTMNGLLEVARSALENFRQFRTSIHGLRGISRDLNRASQRLVNASDGLLSFMERVEAFAVRAIDLSKERLEGTGA